MNLLPRNEHNVERIIRVLVGAGVLSLAFIGPATPWGWLGLIPLATGLIGSCPIYTLFGISTCPMKPTNGTTPR
ncbi:MAG: DUF2892 domain-containing protein [Myxococcales bacterium]|nr:DUF2892 domain-containing protein [Myxococcales bacterium]